MKQKIKRLGIILFSCFMLVSCFNGNIKNLEKVSMNKVIDGDTILISIDGKNEAVRMLLVDAPEIRGSYPLSSEAKDFVKERLKDDEYIYLDRDNQERDNAGRILAYVYHYDNGRLKMLNDEVISNGFGIVSNTYENAKYLKELIKSQDLSKSSGKNIWGIEGYVSENGYKKP